MPSYCLAILIGELPALQAAEQIGAVQAAVAPHMERQAYGRLMRRLRTYALPAPTPKPIPFIRHDPQAAAQWFREHGLRVVTSDDAEKVESA